LNILIIGNGFDLAHKLQTKYVDFLKYCKRISQSKNYCISDFPIAIDEFLKDNIWLKYFLDITNFEDDKTWIDFENEISKFYGSAVTFL
jgi:hypothetical protein